MTFTSSGLIPVGVARTTGAGKARKFAVTVLLDLFDPLVEFDRPSRLEVIRGALSLEHAKPRPHSHGRKTSLRMLRSIILNSAGASHASVDM
jgi:hypothetical protein